MSLKLVCALTGCAAFLFSGSSAYAQLMGLTEEEYIQQHGVPPVTGEQNTHPSPQPATAPAPTSPAPAPVSVVGGRLGELQNRSILASCIPLPIQKAFLQGGVKIENCVQLRGVDVLGFWDGTGRSAKWKVSGARPGKYEMVVLYSFLNTNDGNKQFRIFADDQTRNWSSPPSLPAHFPAVASIVRPAFNLSSGEHWVGMEALSPTHASIWLLNAHLIPENTYPSGTVVLNPACGQSVGLGRFYHDYDINFVLGGHFDNPGDGLFWDADIPETGNYLVEIEYSSRRYQEGRRMKLSIAGEKDLYWKLPYTGPMHENPRPFKTQLVDVVPLSKGKRRITVTLDEKGYYTLDLFQVRFVPVDDTSAARLGRAVSLTPEPEQHKNETAPTKAEPAIEPEAARDFPELHEPPPYLHLLQEHTRLVEKDRKNLHNRFLSALQKKREQSVKENDFAAVARIHALIVHAQEGAGAPLPKDLPANLKRGLDAYKFRTEKLLQDAKLRFISDLEGMRKSLVASNDFDNLTKVQLYIEEVQAQSPENVFSEKLIGEKGSFYMPGTWINKRKDGAAEAVIVIRPDGTCSRFNCVPGTNEPTILKKTHGPWDGFTVRKKGVTEFHFHHEGFGIVGIFHFLDEKNFSMPWHGDPGIYTRAGKNDKPYRLEE